MSQRKTHSRLSASASSRWMSCPGSVALSRNAPPQVSSEAADEGTAAHALSERCLNEGLSAKDFLNEEIKGFLVTDEMVSSVDMYVDYVRSRHREVGGVLLVEKHFNLEQLHPGLMGTNDACIIRRGRRLVVIDFKYGFSPVDATNNKQLLYYGLGAAHEIDFDFTELELVIVQPRAPHANGPVRSWVVSKQYLVEWSYILIQAAALTLKENAQLVRGEWCKYCPAKGLCPKMNEVVTESLGLEVIDGKPLAIESLSDTQIVRLIENRKLIEDFIEGVKSYALHRLKSGERIEGLKLVAGRGRRDWANTDLDQAALVSALGDDAFEKKLLTVPKAEKLLGKNGVDGLYVDYMGDDTVAHASDRRKEIQTLNGKLILNKKEKQNA